MADRGEGVVTPNQQQPQQQNQQQQQSQPQHDQQQQNQQQQDQPQQQHLHLNWPNFKPEFSEEPEEDAEVHLLCSNDWMNAHHFVKGVKVQRFCLTLLGKVRLWYQSLQPINVDWPNCRICLGKDIQK